MREWSTSGPTGIVPSPRSQAPDSRSSGTDYQQILTPTLRAGQVVAMDNLAVHKSAQARELVEAQGRELLFLPPYSPDLNPIEEAFSKMKGLLRRIGPAPARPWWKQ
jgi:transposase